MRPLLPAVLLAALATGCPKPSGTAPGTGTLHTHLGAADLDVALPENWETRVDEDNGQLHDELFHHGDPFIVITLHVRDGCSGSDADRPDYLPSAFLSERAVPRLGGYQDIYVCMPRHHGDVTARITVHGEVDGEAAQVRAVLEAIAKAG
jgi:hypothetical protein